MLRFGKSRVAAWVLSGCVAALVIPRVASAAEPLHQRVNALLARKPFGPTSRRCTDAEFLRRTTLNLTGTIPSSDVARKFIADNAPDKRAKLVDRLLASPEYVRHFTDFFDVMFTERRTSKQVKAADWKKYLYDSVAAGKPYNQLAREILAGTHDDANLAAAAKFYFDRVAEPNQLTRDVARIFFGKDLQCAQCHDHPIVDNFKQADYYGIYAAVNRSYIHTDKKTKKTLLAEKADGFVDFKSVFTQIEGRTLPRLPGMPQALDEPVFPQGAGYVKATATGLPAKPIHSRRKWLARQATTGANRAFNRNIANRLWRAMMGRGLVEPVDYLHPDNSPSHPELLELLADEFARGGFDVKSFLREIALTEVYQRSFELPPQLTGGTAKLSDEIARLESEHKRLEAVRMQSEKVVVEIETRMKPIKAEMLKIEAVLAKANAAIAAEEKKAAPKRANVVRIQGMLDAKRAQLAAVKTVLGQTETIAKQIPGDKELAVALATFRKKADEFAKRADALAKSVALRKKEAQPFVDKVLKAQKAAEPTVAKLKAARLKLAPLDVKLAQAIVTWKRDQVASNSVGKRLEHAKSFASLHQRKQLLAAAQSKRNTILPKLDTLTAQVAQLSKTLQPQLAELRKLEQHVAAAKQAVAVAERQMAEAQAVAGALAAAVRKADTAIASLPQDAELAKAVATLKARSNVYNTSYRGAQQKLASIQAGMMQTATKLAAASKAAAPQTSVLRKRRAELVSLQKQHAQLTAKIAADTAEWNDLREKLAQQLTNRFAVRPLQPLKPEQVAWSMMDATGFAERYRQAEIAAFKKKNPKFTMPTAPEQRAAWEQQIERAVSAKLQGNVNIFVRLFGAAAGQPQDEFFATVDQSLFLANGGSLRSWLSPSGTNLTARLLKLKDDKAVADELYLSVLTRYPTKAEIADVTAYLKNRTKDRTAALQEIAWGLLTSAEFRFNH